MTNSKPIDYEALCDELLKHYLEPEYYLITKSPITYVTTKVTATALDEYIKLLIDGYINVEIREELEKYLTEQLENEWFYQWPLVRWAYFSRLLHRKLQHEYGKDEENIDDEIRTLDALAKEGCLGAITDIALCYRLNKMPSENYEQSICLLIYASRKGYREARARLYIESLNNEYEKLCEELQLFILDEAARWLLEDNGATLEDYEEKLEKWSLEQYKRMNIKRKKLLKTVSERTFMRKTVGTFFWPNGESPYDIKY